MKLLSYSLVFSCLLCLTACGKDKPENLTDATEVVDEEEAAPHEDTTVGFNEDYILKKGPTYKVAIDKQNYTPFLIFDKADRGNFTGFDIDLMNAIAEVANFDIEYVPVEFSEIFNHLENQQVDLTINGLTETDERNTKFLPSQPYLNSVIGYLVKKNAPETKAKQLIGKTVAVEKYSYQEDIARKIGHKDIVVKDTLFSAFRTLFSGEAYTALGEEPIMLYESSFFQNDYPMRFIPLNNKVDKLVIYGRLEQPELMQQVNKGLKKVIENGTYQKINQQWFGDHAQQISITN